MIDKALGVLLLPVVAFFFALETCSNVRVLYSLRRVWQTCE